MNYTATIQDSPPTFESLNNQIACLQWENSLLKSSLQQTTDDRDFWMQEAQKGYKQTERVEYLESNLSGTRARLRLIEEVTSHPDIRNARDRILLKELTLMYLRKPKREDGKVETGRDELKQSTHLSEDAITDGWKQLKAMGYVDGTNEKITGSAKKEKYVYSITKEFIDSPRSVHPIEGSQKIRGGKQATTCTSCGSPRIKKTRKKGTLCECKDCSNKWMEDENDKVIMEAGTLPQDYAEGARHQKEATKEFDNAFKAANTAKPQQASFIEATPLGEPEWITQNYGPAGVQQFDNELTKHMDTMFPADGPQPPRKHPLCHPEAGWVYDDLIEKFFCEVCNHG